MATYLSGDLGQEESAFIERRVGCEGMQGTPTRMRGVPMWFRVFKRLKMITSSARQGAACAAAFMFLGPRGLAALREGLFRDRGEVHQWMYDRFSLGRALGQSGFVSIRRCRADDSDIASFAAYGLEIKDGMERKPDSLYMEARKSMRP